MRRILTFLAALTMIVAAQAATEYGFYCGGVWVTSDNYKSIVAKSSYISSGTVTYDPDNNILTLTNCTISRTGSDNRAIHNKSCNNLTVVLEGTNNFYSRDAAPIKFESYGVVQVKSGTTTLTGGNGGIVVSGGKGLQIKGPGKLVVDVTGDPAVEGINGTYNSVGFENIVANLHSPRGALVGLYQVRYDASSITLKATGSSSYPVVRNVKSLNGYSNLSGTILAPMGATYSKDDESVTLNGVKVWDKDIYISNNYWVIINATNFPDAAFRSYLLSLYPKGYMTEAEMKIRGSLNLSGKSISSLSGIKYFWYLYDLDCSNNSLTGTGMSDLQYVTTLSTLDCHGNGSNLTSLNLSKNIALKTLNCSYNALTGLDLSELKNLRNLNCDNNQLTTLTLPTAKDNLTVVGARNNNLKRLTINDYTALTTIDVGSMPSLTYLSVEGCKKLSTLNCPGTSLGTLVVKDLKELTTVICSNITTMTGLNVSGCGVKSLNVDGCTALSYLACSNNALGKLDLSTNTALQTVYCYGNDMMTLSFSPQATGLNEIHAYRNRLNGTSLDATIASLPTVDNKNINLIAASDEHNAATDAQVRAARARGWNICYENSAGFWHPYKVEDFLRGDVNGDGVINATDLGIIVNIIAGLDRASNYDGRADVNNDNVINATDLGIVVNIIAGLE